jgi:hypothetical protein
MRPGLSGLPRGVASLAILSVFILLFLISRFVVFVTSLSLGRSTFMLIPLVLSHLASQHHHLLLPLPSFW